MAAIIRLHRCHDPLFRSHLYPIHHHFSTSSDPSPNSPGPETDSERQSSYFKDVKAHLQRESQPYMRPQTQRPLPFSNAAPTRAPPSKVASFQEISKNLSELRRRSASPPPSSSAAPPSKVDSFQELSKNLSDFRRRPGAPPPSSSAASSQPLSLQEIYRKNLTSQTDGSNSTATSKYMPTAAGGKISFDTDKLRQMREKTRSQGHQNDPSGKPMDIMSLASFKESLKLKPGDTSASQLIIGGGDSLPASVFGKDKKNVVGKDNEASSARTVEFVRAYSYEEMGKKLQSLRPEKKNGKWFSLQELNDRLVKMRVLEEKEIEESGSIYELLRQSFMRQPKKESGTPSFMLKPPKEHLVEKGLNDMLAKKKVLEEKEIEESGSLSSLYKELWELWQPKKESGTPSFMLKPPKEHLVEKSRGPKEIRPSEQEEKDWHADRRAMKKLLGENFYFQ